MGKVNTVICFTASYPFGDRETYFETELKFIASIFERVYIMPLYNPYGATNKREVPSNVEVLNTILPQGILRVFLGLFNLSGFGPYFSELQDQKLYYSLFKIKKWFNSLLTYRLASKKFKKIKIKVGEDATLYSYWAEIPLFISPLCKDMFKIVRMHGADFYLDRNRGYLPVRQAIYDSADVILPISNDIVHKLSKYYKFIDMNKVKLSYLGTTNKSLIRPYYVGNVLKVLSCSHVYPLKRVNLILEALNKVNSSIMIEWHHVGGGDSLQELQDAVNNNSSENIKVKLFGKMSQSEITKLYEENYYHWFVNVSTHEGLPVTLMECFSFGIPAIGTNVGAVNEIINEYNGHLLEREFSLDDLAGLLENYKGAGYLAKRKSAYETWLFGFNADINYGKLPSLFGLKERRTPLNL